MNVERAVICGSHMISYKYIMSTKPISVTLQDDNVTWLKGRSRAAGESVSALLDQLVTAARQSGQIGPARSVVGTIDVDSSDPLLAGADAAVVSLFEESLQRPLIVREGRVTYGGRPRTSRKRRG
jgi:hypothetical protein